MVRRFCLTLAAIGSLALIPSLFSQSTYATITGVVTDSTGAVLPNATIEGVESSTGYRYTARSNEAGAYTLSQLREGTYRVHTSLPGLADSIIEGIELRARDERRIDVTLSLAAVATKIEVTSAAALIETESSRISDTKSRELFRALPATIRRPWDFVNLSSQTRVSSFSTIRYAGSGPRQGEQAQDGMVVSNGSGSILSRSMDYTEQYEEIRIDSAGNSAEFATLGQMNMTSRGGANEWHGSAFDYYATPGLEARNTFSAYQTKTKPRHDVGGAIGGPVIFPKLYNGRNKTFFMFVTAFRKTRGDRILLNPTVPLVPWRTGDFSGLLPTTVIKDPRTGLPFANNMIPLDRLNAVSLKLQSLYPLPNQPTGSQLVAQNYLLNRFEPNYALPGYNARVDHRLSDKSSLFFRYFQAWWILVNPGTDSRNLPTVPLQQGYDDTRMFMGSHTYTFTPTLVNEVRGQFGYSRSWQDQPLNGKDAVASLGLQGLVSDLPSLGGYPNISLSNTSLTQLTFPYATNPSRRDRSIQAQDHLSWFRGKHSVKTGVQFSRYSTLAFTQDNGLFGNVTFSNRYTGNTYADFLLGIPSSASRSFVKPADDLQRITYGFFVSDEYKISPKLTLTLGLRYDLLEPYTHAGGLISAFDVNTGNILVPDSSLSKVSPLLPTGYVKVVGASQAGYTSDSLIKTDKNNFAPRIGAAWRPFGPNTVFRGGFGIYYDVVPTQLTSTGVPFVITEPTFTNPATNPTLIFPQVFPATSTGAPLSVTLPNAVRPDIRIPYSIQYTATIEHAFRNTAIRMSYAGTGTRQGVYGYNVNQPVPDTRLYINKPRPFPLYPAITYITNGAGHQYHGGSLNISRRQPLYGLSWFLNYTLARDIGDLFPTTSAPFVQLPENAYDRKRERSAWTDIPTHRAVGIFVYELPFGRGKAFASHGGKIVDSIVSGWRLSSKNSYETGLFLTPLWTGPDPTGTAFTSNSTPAIVTIRPNQIADPALANPTRDRWFNPAAFAPPTPGSFGSAAKGVIIGPNLVALGGSLQKFIPLGEGRSLRLEILTNNWLNHPNYNQPAANISNTGSVGVISGQGLDGQKQDDAGPRRILLQARFEF